jgi:hypothetical protein
MRNKMTVFLALGLLAVLFIFPGMTGAQEQKSQLYSIEEIVVRPAMAAKFEAAVKKEIELGYPYPFSAYSTDDFYYYFLTPIENYASIDALNKAESEWAKKIGENHQALMKSVEGTFEYYRLGVIRFLPELSYPPKKPRLKPEEVNFTYWGFLYVEFGKEKEFADVFKQWVELYKSKDIPDGWSTYVVESGAEMPFYFMAASGKSAADFYAADEKATKKIGEEKTMELGHKTMALFRKFEIKTGRPRPDLSNVPKTK